MNDKAPLVTILGAGIAGLTAAHELVERGFRVQVIEKNHGMDPPQGRDQQESVTSSLHRPDVGGVARTQWCTAPSEIPPGKTARLTSVNAIDWLGWKPGHWKGTRSCAVAFDESGALAKGADFVDWVKTKGGIGPIQLVIVVYRKKGVWGGIEAAYGRLSLVWKKLKKLANVQFLPVARVEVDRGPDPNSDYVGVVIRHHDDDRFIAGEHGYRFFPGCYRHLRDTMRRTPIFDHAAQRFETSTVHDNLTPLRYQVVVDPTRDSRAAFSRKPPSSLAAVVMQYQDLRRDLGYRPADLLRFSLRLLRYMTSSTARRRRYYETISWWDFLTLRHLDRKDDRRLPFGQRYERVLEHALQTVVAVKTPYADARTVGNFSVQLTTSGYGDSDVDSTLRGPSSEVWFKHWREYLELRGVAFFVGEVTAIDGNAGNVEIQFPDGAPRGYEDANAGRPRERYIVCAMDAPSVRRVTSPDGSDAGSEFAELVPPDVEKLAAADAPEKEAMALPRGRFQTLSGIQFYYRARLSPDVSHIYYADSAWSLSAISQVQQWDSPHLAPLRLSSKLSINVGSWRPRESAGNGGDLPLPSSLAGAPDPLVSTPEEIADEVRRQISAGRVEVGATAAYFHIDDYIQFDAKRPRWNRAPYLVNLVGDWNARPEGEPWSPSDPKLRPRLLGDGSTNGHRWTHKKGGYVVHGGSLVFAGPHMRTFTRLTSMEAANESARHAVNAILDHIVEDREDVHRTKDDGDALRDDHPHEERVTPHGAYCDIWDPEQNEFADLEFIRLIDKHLVEAARVDPLDADDAPANKPARAAPLHIFDMLGLDHLPDMIDDDASSARVFDLLAVAIDALQKITQKDPSAVMNVIDVFKKRFEELVPR